MNQSDCIVRAKENRNRTFHFKPIFSNDTMTSEEDQVRNYLAVAISWNVYLLSSTLLFWTQRKKEIIRKRNVTICMVQVVAVFGASNVWLAKLLVWPYVFFSVPWLLLLFTNYFCSISWQLTYFLRATILLNEYYTNRLGAMLNHKTNNMEHIVKQLGLVGQMYP
ncbi:hypothetical protein BKA69DRAFT_1056108 [Paraphysoderma sedebokerense]|nr:hypothetical protein BKA69DRAFT_1056108 [Paraphysoderma sedebokerense]